MVEMKMVDMLVEDDTAESPLLEEIRFDSDQSLVIPFTREVGELPIHWFDRDGCRGFYRCDGPGCILCKAGFTPHTRYFIPFYVLDNQSVRIATVPASDTPKSFYPQVKNLMKAAEANGNPVLLTVTKHADTKSFTVKGEPVPANVDDGAAVIAKFKADQAQKKIDMASIIPPIPVEEFKELPSIVNRLKAKGVN